LPFAQACLDLGFYISASGIATFAKPIREVVQKLPIQRLLIETDAPYLSPAPHRGKRNEPAFVRYTAISLAQLFNMPLAEFAAITTANTRSLFNISQSKS
jgi:TatD DNase family protein